MVDAHNVQSKSSPSGAGAGAEAGAPELALSTPDPSATSQWVNPLKSAHPSVLAVASAVVLWSSFPTIDWSWMAWVALVPIFALIEGEFQAWKLYGSAWLGGSVFWLLAIHWVRLADETAFPGYLLMALLLSTGWPLFLWLTRVAVHQWKCPVWIAAPVVWVGIEFVRAHLLTGFAWYYLAHSQWKVAPLIQIADMTGSLGLSLVIALVNAAVALTATRGLRAAKVPLIVALAIVASCWAYGEYRLRTARFLPGPRVALLQSNIPQTFRVMTYSIDETLSIMADLTREARSTKPPPDLIIWPETSYPIGHVVIDPQIESRQFQEQARQASPETSPADWIDRRTQSLALLRRWAAEAGAPMLVGTTSYEFQRSGFRKYNAAILIQAKPENTAIPTYAKIHLVPFGEYVPLLKSFPWLTVLTPYRGMHIPDLDYPDAPSWIDWNGTRAAVAICFEDTVPQAVGRLFRESPQGRAVDVLINMTNDGWFRGSSEHDMHLAISVFRAVEHRSPLVRAVNTGISAVIDGNGILHATLPKLKAGVLSEQVLLDPRQSLYTYLGDWMGWGSLALCVGLAVCDLGRRVRIPRFARVESRSND